MNADQLAALNLHQRGEQCLQNSQKTTANPSAARAELSNAPLTWAFHLANDAQQHANQLAAADRGLQHSQLLHHQGQGENLASLGTGPTLTQRPAGCGTLRRKIGWAGLLDHTVVPRRAITHRWEGIP